MKESKEEVWFLGSKKNENIVKEIVYRHGKTVFRLH